MGAAAGVSITGGWRHHWAVLKDAWALETQRGQSRQTWRETDFLPAALEVVETPPNPLGRIILWSLMIFLALALFWSFVARIDVVAVAPGKVITVGRNKLVQAAEGGVVQAIHVRDGEQVVRGQPLLTLDATTSAADREQAIATLQTAQVDAARSRALLAGLAGRPATFVTPAGLPEEVAVTQRALIASRLDELRSRIAALRGQAAEADASRDAARADAERLQATLPFLAERVEKRRELTDKGFASKMGQLEIDQQRVDHERQIAVQTANAQRAQATIAGIAAQIAQARSEAEREVLADLAKAEADIRLATEELTKAEQRTGLQVIRAPANGTVQQLAVYTEGAVLKPADPILVIVPDGSELEVEAKVMNRDIGFVRTGQEVTVKLEAFPFTRYGTLKGRLTAINRDAVADEQLGPVYMAHVAVERPSAAAQQLGVTISPGMAATAEITTDERRVIDYLLSPIERRVDEAGRER